MNESDVEDVAREGDIAGVTMTSGGLLPYGIREPGADPSEQGAGAPGGGARHLGAGGARPASQRAIARQSGVEVDFMRAHEGGFVFDVGKRAHESPNVATAQAIAERLRAHGCVQVGSGQPTQDDNGHPTTTIVWRMP